MVAHNYVANKCRPIYLKGVNFIVFKGLFLFFWCATVPLMAVEQFAKLPFATVVSTIPNGRYSNGLSNPEQCSPSHLKCTYPVVWARNKLLLF